MEPIQAYWNGVLNWLEAHSRWSQLRALGNSNLVRASVLMPVFGYMLLLNDNVQHYLTIKYDGRILNYLPSIWRIWLLFYGSFLVAIGTILYGIFCPSEVKRYASAFEMAESEAKHQRYMGQIVLVQSQLRSLFERLTEWERKIYPAEPPRMDATALQNTDHLVLMSGYLIHQWTIRNIQRPPLRIAMFALFSGGLALLAIPAAFTFLQVTALAVKRIFS